MDFGVKEVWGELFVLVLGLGEGILGGGGRIFLDGCLNLWRDIAGWGDASGVGMGGGSAGWGRSERRSSGCGLDVWAVGVGGHGGWVVIVEWGVSVFVRRDSD